MRRSYLYTVLNHQTHVWETTLTFLEFATFPFLFHPLFPFSVPHLPVLSDTASSWHLLGSQTLSLPTSYLAILRAIIKKEITDCPWHNLHNLPSSVTCQVLVHLLCRKGPNSTEGLSGRSSAVKYNSLEGHWQSQMPHWLVCRAFLLGWNKKRTVRSMTVYMRLHDVACMYNLHLVLPLHWN